MAAALGVNPERQKYLDEVSRINFSTELSGSRIDKTRDLSGRKCARIYLEFKTEKGRDAFLHQIIDSKRQEMVEYKRFAMNFREVGEPTKLLVHITIHGHSAYQDPGKPDKDIDAPQDSELEALKELGQTTALERICGLLNGFFKTDQFKA